MITKEELNAQRSDLSQLRAQDGKAAPTRTQKEILQLKKEASAYIIKCHKAAGQTDYFRERGLTDETIRRFKLGYDPARKMAVIPFSSTYYAGRNVRIGADEKGPRKHSKPPGLSQPLFNLSALSHTLREPAFLTEAPFDAMSIEQSGGRALALGDSSTTLLKKILDIYRPSNVFILAFDNDDKGKLLRDRVAQLLEERNLPYSIPAHSVFFAYKDANAALMGNAEALAEGVAFERERAVELADREQPHSTHREAAASRPARSKAEAER